MGKRKYKPLLADQGILHLKSSFVQPSCEDPLLSTVGGETQPLVLASGTYGYGILRSTATQQESKSDDEDRDAESVQIVREMNGGAYYQDDEPPTKISSTKGSTDEEKSIGELVRAIGGAKDVPLRNCDVVDDNQEESQDNEEMEIEDDEETQEFYASLGIEKTTRLKGNAVANNSKEEKTDNQNENIEVQPATDEIRDFYKTYTQYYYSQSPNPYGNERLEFSAQIIPDVSASDDRGEATIIQLARMAQIRARQARAAANALEKAKKAKSLPAQGDVISEEADIYDPLPMEVIPSTTAEDLGITTDTTLEQYWNFVKDDPHDFNRWIYLIEYAEKKDKISYCRKVYSAFLPLYPYCYGYWIRYSDMEKKFNYIGRAQTILERGLQFIPLSVDLWKAYLKIYAENHSHDPNFESLFREQYNKAIDTCGMEFRSDLLWEEYIDWEIQRKNLHNAYNIYTQVLKTPTRMYNRHWDNFKAMIRDHHPRDYLEKEYYEKLREKGCRLLGFKYKREGEFSLTKIRKTSKPEDQLMDYVKTTVIKEMTTVHENCEKECEIRWKFEDKIKRPYFHTKPLDKYQLRTWDDYLNYEISIGNHDRIVLLFERCLIACALYERFWCRYARYLEQYYKKKSKENASVSVYVLKNQENIEIGSQKDTKEEETRICDVECVLLDLVNTIVRDEEQFTKDVSSVVNRVVNKVCIDEFKERYEIYGTLQTVLKNVCGIRIDDLSELPSNFFGAAQRFVNNVNNYGFVLATEYLQKELSSPKLIGDSENSGLPVKSGEEDADQSSTGLNCIVSIPIFPPAKLEWQESIRDVYKRACTVHCPKKPSIRLQWASFEEELGNYLQAEELVKHVQRWFPDHMEAKLLHLEMTKRHSSDSRKICLQFEDYLKNTKKLDKKSLLSLKYARYLHKELRKPDKALKVLRNAIKSDKKNPRLYSYLVDICYDKYPEDKKAVFAALELVTSNKDFTDDEKLIFLRRKLLLLQEHGDIYKYRETLEKVREQEDVIRKKAEEESRIMQEQNRLKLLQEQAQLPPLNAYPVPEISKNQSPETDQAPIPIEFEPLEGKSNSVSSQPKDSEGVRKEAGSFKEVAPPLDINLSDYGYSSKHPDYKVAEYMAHREYEKLESQGYPEHLKDTAEDKKELRKRRQEKEAPVYIVKPRSEAMFVSKITPSSTKVGETAQDVPQSNSDVIELQMPQALSTVCVPSNSPCVNVPEWFVKDGGELCISETVGGFSVLRYWPNFLKEDGQGKMFKCVRRNVKWHQKQRVVREKWKYVPYLVSYLGPCDFYERGLELKKNENWPPEILDLLHRLNQITNYGFNCCFLSLYRNGHDYSPWKCDMHPAYGVNPPIATVSLGQTRLLEMKKKFLPYNFLRFPLNAGSLILVEGATQCDWLQSIPRDPSASGERICLVFKVMHAIENMKPTLSTGENESSSDPVAETEAQLDGVNKSTGNGSSLVVEKPEKEKKNESADDDVQVIDVINPTTRSPYPYKNKKKVK